jgi:hypothetical protein
MIKADNAVSFQPQRGEITSIAQSAMKIDDEKIKSPNGATSNFLKSPKGYLFFSPAFSNNPTFEACFRADIF